MEVGDISNVSQQNQNVNGQTKQVNQAAENNQVREVKDQVEQAQAEGKPQGEEPSKKEIEEAIEKMNKTVEPFHKELNFKLHDKAEQMMVEVVNIEKHEVIKTMPPKELLDALGKIREMVGLLIDKKIY